MAEKEYIEREAARKYILDEYPLLQRDRLMRTIDDIPAADARPVVRGKWVYNAPFDNIPYCSECLMPQGSECNFCPNCGADMREES